MKKISKILIGLLAVSAVVLTVIKPEIYVKSAFDGLKLWCLVVLPTLLPFFFLTALMTKLKITDIAAKITEKPASELFGVGGAASYVFIMSVLSGYPVGAKIVADLKQRDIVSDKEAVKIAAFCSTSGPLFIISSVGIGMFGDKKTGVVLFASHVLAALCVGLVFRFYGGKTENKNRLLIKSPESSGVLYECVYSSVISVAVVGGFICVFYVFADMAQNTGILAPFAYLFKLVLGDEELSYALISGLIECTRGCRNAALTGTNIRSVIVAEALISFGGASVIAQSAAFLSKAKISVGAFIIAKILQTAISIFFCALFFNAFFN